MAKGPVSRLIEQRVRQELDRHGVVVWYDPAGSFSRLVGELDLPQDTFVARFTDSFYRLRDQVDVHFGRLSQAGEPADSWLLVYVPQRPLPRRLDVLLGLSASGRALQEGLPSFAREALRGKLAEPSIEELVANPNITLEELDRIAETGGAGGIGAVLTAIFGTLGTHEVSARYLIEPALDAVIDGKGALPALKDMAQREFGLFGAEAQDAASFRRLFARHVLLNDFRSGLGLSASVPSLEGLALPAPNQVASCLKTADYMRHHTEMRQPYAGLAQGVETECGLTETALPVEAARACETFAFIDDLCLLAVEGLADEGQLAEATELAEHRRQSFWAGVDEERSLKWHLALSALRLCEQAARVKREAKGVRRPPADLVARYAGQEANWHRVDLLQRVFERDVRAMPDGSGLGNVLDAAREAYEGAAGAMAETLLQSLAEHGFAFHGVTPQLDTFHRHVEPWLKKEPVAYFLVDALRYEMAADLAGQFEGADWVAEVELSPVVAAVPTITPVGMAALMPGAEHGLSILEGADRGLDVRVGGVNLAQAPARCGYLASYTGDTALDLTLKDLLATKKYHKPGPLAEDIRGKQLIVVRSTVIDDQGELDNPETAWGTITGVLADLRKAFHRLAAAGVRRFVVTADHGFILGGELSDPQKIDPPGGQTVLLKRRCWVGRGGNASPATVRFSAAQLGHGGDLEFVFPNGRGVFKASGAGTYYHGGLSLQELVVPVLTFRALTPGGEPPGDRWDLRYEASRITNRLFMAVLAYQQGTVGKPVRRVRCEVLIGGELAGGPATAQYGYDSGTQEIALETAKDDAVTLMVRTALTSGQAELRLVDADTGMVLARKGPLSFEFTS
jgi:hypothetical protein